MHSKEVKDKARGSGRGRSPPTPRDKKGVTIRELSDDEDEGDVIEAARGRGGGKGILRRPKTTSPERPGSEQGEEAEDEKQEEEEGPAMSRVRQQRLKRAGPAKESKRQVVKEV